MRYLKFVIQDYKAISGSLEIDVSKKPLLPLIGVNESGKTSILWAIFSFDHFNDELNDGRHLNHPSNLYKTTEEGEPFVTAYIEISEEELKSCLSDIEDDSEILEEEKKEVSKVRRQIKDWDEPIQIKRNLKNKDYSIENDKLKRFSNIIPHLVDAILGETPYILYFDDFRDKVEEEIEIPNERTIATGWLSFIETLFKKTHKDLSVFKLRHFELLKQKSVLSDVCETLNKTLSREWQKFTVEGGSLLEVELSYEYRQTENRQFLKLSVKEKINGKDRYFGIQDRSKGFFWFFNFVMRLEFNPKVRNSEDKDTIYLLDEPGSYLHSSAQAKLCEKLARLSKDNVVIYCTHSHYLLNPDIIPLSSVRVVKKEGDSIKFYPITEYKDSKTDRRMALQPIMDALQIKPFLTDLSFQEICITEGIMDYYVFEMFKGSIKMKFLPSTDANSIAYFISIAIAWRLNYVALWDNDEEGRKALKKAQSFFGDEESKRFLTLPSERNHRNYILQNLFEGNDLQLIKDSLQLPKNTAFEKTILAFYFSPNRQDIIAKISNKTKSKVDFVLGKIKGVLGI